MSAATEPSASGASFLSTSLVPAARAGVGRTPRLRLLSVLNLFLALVLIGAGAGALLLTGNPTASTSTRLAIWATAVVLMVIGFTSSSLASAAVAHIVQSELQGQSLSLFGAYARASRQWGRLARWSVYRVFAPSWAGGGGTMGGFGIAQLETMLVVPLITLGGMTATQALTTSTRFAAENLKTVAKSDLSLLLSPRRRGARQGRDGVGASALAVVSAMGLVLLLSVALSVIAMLPISHAAMIGLALTTVFGILLLVVWSLSYQFATYRYVSALAYLATVPGFVTPSPGVGVEVTTPRRWGMLVRALAAILIVVPIAAVAAVKKSPSSPPPSSSLSLPQAISVALANARASLTERQKAGFTTPVSPGELRANLSWPSSATGHFLWCSALPARVAYQFSQNFVIVGFPNPLGQPILIADGLGRAPAC